MFILSFMNIINYFLYKIEKIINFYLKKENALYHLNRANMWYDTSLIEEEYLLMFRYFIIKYSKIDA